MGGLQPAPGLVQLVFIFMFYAPCLRPLRLKCTMFVLSVGKKDSFSLEYFCE
jgi:hypothetical protein